MKNKTITGFIPLLIIGLLLLPAGGCKKEKEDGKTDIAWLRDELVAISSTDPAENDAALEVILQKVGNAQIVGLGEATHGTTEFWSIRQKITRYLIEKKGFRAILMEASFPGSFALHDYIAAGTGVASEAHQKLGSWRYKEMQDLISWMRQYNIDHSDAGNGPALHFYGYDCAFSSWSEPVNLITSYLQKVDAGEADNIKTHLLNHTKEDAVFVNNFFISKAAPYISLSSEKEYNTILRIVKNLEPSWEIWNRLSQDKPTMEYRDSVNILNVNWIMENLLNGGKVVLWAHNGHIRNGYMNDDGGKAHTLGFWLHSQYGASYYPVATEFYDGHFLAWDNCRGHDFLFVDNKAAFPPVDSYTYLFEQAGVPLFFLDFSQIINTDVNASWIFGQKRIRMIGALYCQYSDFQYYDTLSLPEYYSGIVFLETSHPTTNISF
jgi:erythromycin esterase